MSDTKMQMCFRAIMDLAELGMEEAGVRSLSIRKRPDGGFDFKVGADKGKDVRECYSHMVQFDAMPDCFAGTIGAQSNPEPIQEYNE
jgi:hypothetical protein